MKNENAILTPRDVDDLREMGRRIVSDGDTVVVNGVELQPIRILRPGFRPVKARMMCVHDHADDERRAAHGS